MIKKDFLFPEIGGLASLNLVYVIRVLPKSAPIATDKILAGIFKFDINLDSYRV